MATNENNHHTAMEAITYPFETAEPKSTEGVPQPRQPNNLQGLLRFAMEATKAEDAPHDSNVGPLDEERKKFLESALKSMTVNVIEVLQKQMETLQNVESVKENDDVDPYIEALETILECVGNIDIANDFHKIGGFNVLHLCFKCSHPEVRAGACDVLAELSQNNPYCQRMVLNENFVPLLLRMLAIETDIYVCVKALYAISCIVRHNSEAFQQMLQYDGLNILLKMLQKGNDKLITKTTFLLSSLCGSQPDLINRLVFLEYIPVLLTLLKREKSPCYEHVLSLLVHFVEESPAVINECKDPKYDLQEILENNLKTIAHKEEFQEEEAYCKRLLNLVFK